MHDGFITDGFPDVIRGIPHNQSMSDYMPDMNKEGISSSSNWYVVSTVDGSFHLLHAFSLANLVSLAVMPSTVALFHAKLFLQPSTDVIWVFRKILGEIPWRSPLFFQSLSGEARKRAISETKSMTTAYIRHTG